MLTLDTMPTIHIVGKLYQERDRVTEALQREPYVVTHHDSAGEFLQRLDAVADYISVGDGAIKGCVLCCNRQSDPDPEAMIAMLALRQIALRVVLIGDDQDVSEVAKAFRWGIFDYVTSPINESRLLNSIHRAIR